MFDWVASAMGRIGGGTDCQSVLRISGGVAGAKRSGAPVARRSGASLRSVSQPEIGKLGNSQEIISPQGERNHHRGHRGTQRKKNGKEVRTRQRVSMRLLPFFLPYLDSVVHNTVLVCSLLRSIAHPSFPLWTSVPSVVVLSRNGCLRWYVFWYLISCVLPYYCNGPSRSRYPLRRWAQWATTGL